VPLSEALVPVLVVAGLPRMAAVWAAALLTAFSIALVGARGRMGNGVPCGCFGGRGSVRLRSALARNAVLLTVAVCIVVVGTDVPAPWLPGTPGLSDALPLTLMLGALVASGLVAWRASAWLGRERHA
jgi:hypothetical protein